MRLSTKKIRPAKKSASRFGRHRTSGSPLNVERGFRVRGGQKTEISGETIKVNEDGSLEVTITLGTSSNDLQHIDLTGIDLSHILTAEKVRKILTRPTKTAKSELRRVEDQQIELYKGMVIERVEHRFSTRAAAEKWFAEGHIPGYGDQTPQQLVAKGHVARVIEAINSIEAGVYA